MRCVGAPPADRTLRLLLPAGLLGERLSVLLCAVAADRWLLRAIARDVTVLCDAVPLLALLLLPLALAKLLVLLSVLITLLVLLLPAAFAFRPAELQYLLLPAAGALPARATGALLAVGLFPTLQLPLLMKNTTGRCPPPEEVRFCRPKLLLLLSLPLAGASPCALTLC